MRVEIWSDVICPWCGIANYRLDRALERVEFADHVEVIHHSFEMAPELPDGEGVSQRDLLAQHGKHGADQEAYIRPIERLAARDGLQPYIVMDNTLGNTALAHELLAYATEQGKHTGAWHRFFAAHFGEGRRLFDIDSLLDLSEEIGLERDKAERALRSRRFRQQVADDKRQAIRRGAAGVPFTIIDERYALNGAQGIDRLVATLERAWQDARQYPEFTGFDAEDGGLCGEDSCGVVAKL